MKLPSGPGAPGQRRPPTCWRRRPPACRAHPHAHRRSRRERHGRRPAVPRAPARWAPPRRRRRALEVVAPFGPPVFIFAATDDDATLLLPRDVRVLEHGRPDDVLDAVAGVPLNAERICATTLTGCAPEELRHRRRAQFGADWRVVDAKAPGATFYLHREAGGPWQPGGAGAARRAGGRRWRPIYRDRSERPAAHDSSDEPERRAERRASTCQLVAVAGRNERAARTPRSFRVDIRVRRDTASRSTSCAHARPGVREN